MFETVREILATQLDIDEDLITEDTDLFDDLGADSLDLVDLVTSIEDEYGFVATDEDVHDIRTVRQVVEYIEKNIPSAN